MDAGREKARRAQILDVMNELTTLGYVHGVDFGIKGVPGFVAGDVPTMAVRRRKYAVRSATGRRGRMKTTRIDSFEVAKCRFLTAVERAWRDREAEIAARPESELTDDQLFERILRSKMSVGSGGIDGDSMTDEKIPRLRPQPQPDSRSSAPLSSMWPWSARGSDMSTGPTTTSSAFRVFREAM